MKVGIDIIEIERIKGAYDNYRDRFLNRVFTKNEIDYSFSKVWPFPHLAVRFSAKEAFMKALGRSLNFNEVEVISSGRSIPEIVLLGRAKNIAESLGIRDVSLSLSHSRDYAVAVVMVVE